MRTIEELIELHSHIQLHCEKILNLRKDQFLSQMVDATSEITFTLQVEYNRLSIDEAIENVLLMKRLETILETVDIYVNTKYGVKRYVQPSKGDAASV